MAGGRDTLAQLLPEIPVAHGIGKGLAGSDRAGDMWLLTLPHPSFPASTLVLGADSRRWLSR